jgi:hypothetical protein
VTILSGLADGFSQLIIIHTFAMDDYEDGALLLLFLLLLLLLLLLWISFSCNSCCWSPRSIRRFG